MERGTGSSCVAIALAKNLPHAELVATDISAAALAIAEANAQSHELGERIRFAQGDLFEALNNGVDRAGGFDFIVSNPPYISPEEMPDLPREVRQYEPRVALLAGDEALAGPRKTVDAACGYLAPRGKPLMEPGHEQAQAARDAL